MRGQNAVVSRGAVRIPPPASPAAAIPAGAQLKLPGISPFVTLTKDFYRVDTALMGPKVDATTWRLKIHGKGVTRPLTLSFEDLLGRELIERDAGLYRYVSACKWVQDIELTAFASYDPYWVKRGWAKQGSVKTEFRIDTTSPSPARRPAL